MRGCVLVLSKQCKDGSGGDEAGYNTWSRSVRCVSCQSDASVSCSNDNCLVEKKLEILAMHLPWHRKQSYPSIIAAI